MSTRTLFVGPMDRVLSLRTLPVLEALVPAQVAAIAQHAREDFFPAGGLLIRAGSPADAFYVVVEGAVTLSKGAVMVRQVGPGEEVGLLQVLARAPTTVEARAASDTIALRLDWDAQVDVWEEHASVLLQYLRYLARRSVEAQMASADGAQLGPEHRAVASSGLPAELSLVERLLAIRAADLLPTAAVDALAELAHHVSEVHVAAGAAVWQPGEEADYFVLVVAGELRCSVPRSGSTLIAGPGAVAGIHEALAAQARWCAAAAAHPTRLLRVDVTALMDILEDHFDLAIEFMSLLAGRLLQLENGA